MEINSSAGQKSIGNPHGISSYIWERIADSFRITADLAPTVGGHGVPILMGAGREGECALLITGLNVLRPSLVARSFL